MQEKNNWAKKKIQLNFLDTLKVMRNKIFRFCSFLLVASSVQGDSRKVSNNIATSLTEEQSHGLESTRFRFGRLKRDALLPNITDPNGEPTLINSDRIITIKENLKVRSSIYNLTGQSNVVDDEVAFGIANPEYRDLFTIESGPGSNNATIILNEALDYEKNTQYIITITLTNSEGKQKNESLTINVADVNDMTPDLIIQDGKVPVNAPIGFKVMKVEAPDGDKSEEYNQVTYELLDHKNLFAIDNVTGDLRTLVIFDKTDTYNLKIRATDNAPSSFKENGEHNSNEKSFHIDITPSEDIIPTSGPAVSGKTSPITEVSTNNTENLPASGPAISEKILPITEALPTDKDILPESGPPISERILPSENQFDVTKCRRCKGNTHSRLVPKRWHHHISCPGFPRNARTFIH